MKNILLILLLLASGLHAGWQQDAPITAGYVRLETGVTVTVNTVYGSATIVSPTGTAIYLAAVGSKKIRVLGYAYFCSTLASAPTVANMVISDDTHGNISVATFGVAGAAEKASSGSFLFETGAGDNLYFGQIAGTASIIMYMQIQYVLVP